MTSSDVAFILLAFLLLILLALQWKFSNRVNVYASVLIKIQAIYWGLSYLGRTTYLWVNKPLSEEVLYDERFAIRGYESLILEILRIVLVGQIAFVAVLWLVARQRRTADVGHHVSLSGRSGILVLIIWLAGWAGRLGSEFGNLELASYLIPFAAFGGAAWVVFMPYKGLTAKLLLSVVIGGELYWSVAGATKTPILTIASAVLIRFSVVYGKKAVFRAIPIMAIVVAVAFLIVQPLKGIDTKELAQQQNQSFSGAVATTILQRTDVTTPVADAVLAEQRPWMNSAEFVRSVITGAFPTGMHDAVGPRWTREIKSQSVPFQYQDVSIAGGVVAEGYVQGGLTGAFLECGLLAAATVGVGRALGSQKIPIALAGAAFAFDSSLYEGGFLWITESGSGAVQVAIFATALWLIVGKPPTKSVVTT